MRIQRVELRARLSETGAIGDLGEAMAIMACAGIKVSEIRASKRTIGLLHEPPRSLEANGLKIDDSMDDLEVVLVGSQARKVRDDEPTLFDLGFEDEKDDGQDLDSELWPHDDLP
jgi:hypothetical protein